jgi:hypothetical protein
MALSSPAEVINGTRPYSSWRTTQIYSSCSPLWAAGYAMSNHAHVRHIALDLGRAGNE